MKNRHKKLIVGLGIFAFVFASFTYALMGGKWGVDDLGVILNGLISNVASFFRVFSEDMRNYATTYNYNLPKSNFISGFLRPIEHVFFSIVYHIFGTNVFAFLVLQALFHAANAFLVFHLFCYWLSLPLASFGALLFAFYPSYSWLAWICTLQHSLVLFFLLIAILLYLPLLTKQISFLTQPLFYASGIAFLASLLSRETHIFLAPWACFGIYLFYTNTSMTFFARVKASIAKTWVFFAATLIYFCMRIYAFGFGSLDRTARNLLIRFPFLEKFFTAPTAPKVLAAPVMQAQSIAQKALAVHETPSFTQTLLKKAVILQNKFFVWVSTIFNVPTHTIFQKLTIVLVILFLLTLLVIAYRKHKTLALFLCSGIPLLLWPCILVYPAPRYMNTTYPYLIFVVLLGVYFLFKQTKQSRTKTTTLSLFLLICTLSLISGFKQNIIALATYNESRKFGESAYTQFFKNHTFPKNSHFIFISTLDESDLEQVLQVSSGDFSLKAAHIVISKLAHKGQYGFQEDYSYTGADYTITPITNGYRFTSSDKHHCSWTFHSYQPVVWSENEHSYVLATEFFKPNRWYEFSMGTFFIHEITDKKYVTDVSFVFYPKWITPNTFFVAWDPMGGRYRILN